ncbi:MAG TPA: hypothetical protein VGC19_12065 [Rhodanobacter sp.]
MRRLFLPGRSVRWILSALALLMIGVAVDSAWAEVAVPADSARAIALNHQLDFYWIVEKLLALLIPALFLCTGMGARLRRFAGRVMHEKHYPTLGLFGCIYVLLATLVSLPFNYQRHYRLPMSLGWLGDETPGKWLLEQLAPLGIGMVGAILFLWVPYALIRCSPKRWWLWSTAVLSLGAWFVLVVQPVWIKPLTTAYAPLADQALRA